jgi:hypothetical protein
MLKCFAVTFDRDRWNVPLGSVAETVTLMEPFHLMVAPFKDEVIETVGGAVIVMKMAAN